jgi:integrase
VIPIQKNREQELLEMAYTWNRRYGLMIHIGLKTGLRIGDILRLRAKDAKRVDKYPLKIIEQKTGKEREINLCPKLVADMKGHIRHFDLSPDNYLIFSAKTRKNKPLSRVRAWQVIKELSVYMGEKRYGTHSFRKTFAREHYLTHKNISALQSELNHKYEATTINYLVDPAKYRLEILKIIDEDYDGK